ncbi:MAG: isopentenyl-diphosphate Delta-isomerase [Gammaproteobacteria bacterium]|nr:isopentenyl-diphosphate Delta-isomerase [Gammaproteobacteria bacterium]MDE0364627.1 isopentenyl-diphosphate Delta-isomerase [Gammaproteobacteria bacterium]
MNTKSEVVSFDDEPLILVDSADRVLGFLDKAACHNGEGQLHRAFSAFVFNARGELLLQKRGREKRLWPNFWSNSCCSHPRRGESMDTAVHRRIEQELGLDASLLHDLRFVYKFEYQAGFGANGSEHELCSVYLARTTGTPVVNTTEIDDWQWIAGTELNRRLEERPDEYTPWLRLEWAALCERHADMLPTGARELPP